MSAPPPSELGRTASFARRFGAYLAERFPPGPMLVVTGLGGFGAMLVVSAALGKKPPVVDLGLGLLVLAYLLLLLLLRILDEFKDWERDQSAYPERVLSRGLVDREELTRAGWGVALAGLGAAVTLGPVSAGLYLACLVYALLMAREFFMGWFLRKDVFVYALVHQPINPLVSLWLLAACADRLGATAARQVIVPGVVLYALALFALGFGFEVSRKLWTPEEEKPDLVDSYSAHAIGPRGAAMVALLLLILGVSGAAGSALLFQLPRWSFAPFGLALLLILVSVGRFAASPFPGASKKLQGAVGLASLLIHLGLIGGLVARLGRPVAAVWVSG